MEVHDQARELQSSGGAETRVIEPSFTDQVAPLAEVYRDYPGLRAFIMRRVRDPQLAADILQDAAVTTLEKLRTGEIAQPSRIGGYLLRVALNHLRNYRRKDRTALSSSEDLEFIPNHEDRSDMPDIDRDAWSRVARELLKELPTPRDRDLLVRYYLNDQCKEDICAALQLSEEHFNRVIFRARNRFRELLERRGYAKSDLLSWAGMAFSTVVVSTVLAAYSRVAV